MRPPGYQSSRTGVLEDPATWPVYVQGTRRPRVGGPRPRVCLGSAPQRAPGRRRVSDGPVNWSCQVDKRDRCAHRRAPPPPLPLPRPRAGSPHSATQRRSSQQAGHKVVDPGDPGDPALALRCPPLPPPVLSLPAAAKASDSLSGAEGEARGRGPVGSGRNRVSECLGRGWDSQVWRLAARMRWRRGGGVPVIEIVPTGSSPISAH